MQAAPGRNPPGLHDRPVPGPEHGPAHGPAHGAVQGTAPRGGERLHALDAVRAIALLLGIVLHGVMSFLPTMALINWPIVDNSPSEALNAIFLLIHMFRMPLFFLMAGFFARLMVERGGVPAFAADRARRILLPFLAGCLLIVPLTAWLLVAMAERQGKALFHPFIPPDAVLLFPMMHLWFLYVLILFYVAFVACRWLVMRLLDRQGRLLPAVDFAVRHLAGTPLGALVLAIPVAVVLFSYPYWWVSLGIPTPDHSLVPNVPALLGFGMAFTLGWLMHRQPSLLQTLARRWAVQLMAAVLLTGMCVAIGGTALDAVVPDDGSRLVYGVAYCTASWCWVFGLVGAALRYLARRNAAMRYLADASYWMYLWHMPLVFALQAVVMQWGVHWGIKAPLVLGVATLVLLASYRWLVRGTWVGRALNGPSLRSAQPAAL